MNLYKVEWAEGGEMNTYAAFVVCCDTPEEARETPPDVYIENTEYHQQWAVDLSELTVTHIGTALPGTQAGLIVVDYMAGYN